MRGEADNEFNGEWSESDTEYPFARQLTITKAKKLIRRHTRKFRSRAQKNSGDLFMLWLKKKKLINCFMVASRIESKFSLLGWVACSSYHAHRSFIL